MFECFEGIVITDPYHINRGNVLVTQFVVANTEKAVSVICKGICNIRKNEIVCLNGHIRHRELHGKAFEELLV